MEANKANKYLTNYIKLVKYFNYYKSLSNGRYSQVLKDYPVLFEASQSFYFRAIIYLCNFLKGNKRSENLRLDNLVNLIKEDNKILIVSQTINAIKSDTYYNNLFNLRDKWIAHSDDKWYMTSQDFPDDVFQRYIDLIKEILQICFVIEIPDEISNDLITKNLLDRIKLG